MREICATRTRLKNALSFPERAVLSVLCLGTLAALLFAAQNQMAPVEVPLSFALVFLGWSLLFYAAVLLPPTAVLWALGRTRAPRWLPHAGLATLTLAFLAVCGVANRESLLQLLNLAGPANFRWLAPLSFVVGALASLVLGVFPWHRAWAPRLLGLATPLLAVAAFWPTSGVGEARPARQAAESRIVDPARRLLLVGLDGADWSFIEPLIARGELPQLASLRARGAWGHLKTFVPTKSPVIWTSIATGQPPPIHGVRDFTSLRVRGVHSAFRAPRLPAALGFGFLYDWLKLRGFVFQSPVVSSSRQVPAFWDLATQHGSPSSVLNWWATWPADALLGSMVSERVYYWRFSARGTGREEARLTYPPELYDEIAGLVMRPDQVRYEQARPFMDVTAEEFAAMMARPFAGKTIEGEFKYIFSMFETDRRIARRLIERTRVQYGVPADMLMLFRIVDLAAHCSLPHSELVQDHLGADPEDLRRYGRVVSEAYRAADGALGEILTAFGESNVVVISDHGFALEKHKNGRRIYHHMKAPDGIFLAAGPAFRPGRVEGLTVYDMLPLMAYLKGFAVADDLRGRVPRRVFDPGFLSARPVVRVASYGNRHAQPTAAVDGQMDEAVIERLRAVGYVQ